MLTSFLNLKLSEPKSINAICDFRCDAHAISVAAGAQSLIHSQEYSGVEKCQFCPILIVNLQCQ